MLSDPYPTKVLLTGREVGAMLGMERTAFARFLAEMPDFPRPILVGKRGGRRRGDVRRWRKDDVILWVLRQPPEPPETATSLP